MNDRTLRHKVAIVGVGETQYFKHGQSPDPEFKLALKAILAACASAGISPHAIDGFASYSDDRNDAVRLATALGIPELRHSSMQWGGGGGGTAAAVAHAAAAIAGGLADCVVVFRALAQGQFTRYGQGGMAFGYGSATPAISGEMAFPVPYGAISPAQRFAMKVRRFMEEHRVEQAALRAIALASYHHAQANPRALMHGRPLSEEQYDASRWIVEPFRLFDCCMENDGAAAIVLVSAERARDFPHPPAYLLGAAAGADYRHAASSHTAPNYATADFRTVARRLYEMARVEPSDVDVVQAYENFTGGVLLSLAEHGFFRPEEANDALTLENLSAPDGRLPLNTSGGHLAECYMHGMNLIIESVRQIWGQSSNQVEDVDVAMMIAGPMVTPVSSLILGSEATR
ncbi:acetyl-CoA acetyltransferase [Afipia sp. GAS231]|uniref:thiolase C-terminal domain-containing protein n=1 Tax=Afipia sp. GAS231 TaxID=1882747 RepID=UPI00087ACEBD|nr:acetyl-CoA acetyltransferase [Afipia sp. GAS231]SDP26763.1 Acetyl-CoA acetyltransferase [Afipia sp. GAS231]